MKLQARFVIFVGPPQQVAPGSCYIAEDGSPTIPSSKATTFKSFAHAKEFAEAHHIVLNGRTYIIGWEDFTDLETQG